MLTMILMHIKMNTQERKLKTRFVYIPPKIILFAYNTVGTSNFGFMSILQESLENPKIVYYAVCGRGGIFVGRDCINLV